MDIIKIGMGIVHGVFSEPADPLTGIVIMAFLLLIVLPSFAVVGSMREVKDNSPRTGLKNPKIAIPVSIIFLFLSWLTGDAMVWNPMFLLVSIGFAWIGIVSLYKKHKILIQ